MVNKEWDYGYEVGFNDGFKGASMLLKDDPIADATDFAHPAWFRGQEQAHLQFVDQVNRILDGEPASGGLSTMPWEALRQRLYGIRTLLGIAERVVGKLPDKDFNKAQWYRVRADYAKRREQQ